MGNCSFKSLIKAIVLFLVLFLPYNSLAYIPETTHAGLTDQIVEFYNLDFQEKINESRRELMIKGSIDEDIPASRALNHFYDPVNNIGIEGGRTSKDWAIDGSIEANEFSWPKAIKYYAEGDESKAFISLGHVLHLFEDAGVPDHTRNDPHMGDSVTGASVYEKWASDNENRNTMSGMGSDLFYSGYKTKIFNSAGEYFDFLAKYSNENFFSPDTIHNKYSYPKLSDRDKEYIYSNDSVSGQKSKVLKLIIDPQDNSKITEGFADRTDKSVLSSYFDRLSKQIITSGAGLVDLFMKEAKEAREEYLAEQDRKQSESVKKQLEINNQISDAGFFGKFIINIKIAVGNKVQNIVLSGKDFLNTVLHGSRNLAQETGNYASIAGGVSKDSFVATQKSGSDFVNDINKRTSGAAFGTLADIVSDGIYRPEQDDSDGSGNQELRISQKDVETIISIMKEDTNSQNTDTSPQKQINISSSVTIGGGFSNANPVKIEEIAIVESEENNTASSTDTTISTSTETVTATTTDTTTASTTEDIIATSTEEIIATSTPVVEALSVVINEVAWAGSASSSEQWIELYNNTDSDVDLSSWSIHSTSSAINIPLSGIIKSRDYFLIENVSSSSPDILPISDIAPDTTVSLGQALNLDGEYLMLAYKSSTTSEETIIDDLPIFKYDPVSDKTEKYFIPDIYYYVNEWTDARIKPLGNYTIERFDTKRAGNDIGNWSQNLGVVKNGLDKNNNPIFGTPKKKNSISYLPMVMNDGSTFSSSVDIHLTKEKSPYLIYGYYDILGNLTVDPGTVVKFYSLNYLKNVDVLGVSKSARIGSPDGEKVIFTNIGDMNYGSEIGAGFSTSTPAGGIEFSDFKSDDASSSERFIYNTNIINTEEGIIAKPYSKETIIDGLDLTGENGLTVYSSILNLKNSSFHDMSNGMTITAYYAATLNIDNVLIKNIYHPISDMIVLFSSNLNVKDYIVDGITDGSAIQSWGTSTMNIDKMKVSNSAHGFGILSYEQTVLNGRDILVENSYGGILGQGGTINLKGLVVRNCDFGLYNHGKTKVLIEDSILEDNGIGIKAYWYTTSLKVTNSSISNNSLYGVINEALSGTLDMKNNWWGSDTGPYQVFDRDNYVYSNPDGLGNPLKGKVDASDWLTERPVF